MKTRVKTPTVLQMEATECGAAALGIILGYLGRFEPLEKLRVECGVSRDGSKAGNMLTAARRYGLDAKGYQKEPEAVKRMLLPVVVFWNFNHYMVVEGFHKDRVYLNDPASGPKVVSEEEFDQSFTGIVLTFKPGTEFIRGGENRGFYQSLMRWLTGARSAFIYLFLTGLALVVPGLVIPVYSKVFIDNILVDKMSTWLLPLLIGMGITAMLRAFLTWLQQYYLLRFETKLALASSNRFFWHVLRLPVEFFSQRYGGEIGSRVALNNKVAELVSGQLGTTALNLIMIVFFAALMFKYDVLLTLVGITIAILNIVCLKYVSRKRSDENQKILQERGKLLGTAMSGLQMIETLKATGSESDFFAQWSGYQAKVTNASQKLSIYTNFLLIVPVLLTSVNTTVILALGGLRIMDGYLTIGTLVAYQSLMASFIAPVNNLVNLGSSLQETEGDMKRLDDVFQYKTDKQTTQIAGTAGIADVKVKLRGELLLKDVSFGYSRLEKPLIEDLCIFMKPGSRIALIGGSGSGKSTVAKLVAGLYEPWNGDIFFDGNPRPEIERRILTNSVAMVDQDIFLFSGTVRENLTLWDTTIPETIMVQAARDACIHDDIAARHQGYDSRIEEGGRNLSGGQRQRMEIARALLINPAIMILDEATSALDPKTELTIDDNLRRRGCTCLIVAHRLSTIRDCDEIIILDNGRIVQRGTHDEMKDAEGPYAELIHSA